MPPKKSPLKIEKVESSASPEIPPAPKRKAPPLKSPHGRKRKEKAKLSLAMKPVSTAAAPQAAAAAPLGAPPYSSVVTTFLASLPDDILLAAVTEFEEKQATKKAEEKIESPESFRLKLLFGNELKTPTPEAGITTTPSQ